MNGRVKQVNILVANNVFFGGLDEKKAGRKEKADDQKSEKTIQNKESMS